jgi:hypothetical protein
MMKALKTVLKRDLKQLDQTLPHLELHLPVQVELGLVVVLVLDLPKLAFSPPSLAASKVLTTQAEEPHSLSW